MHAQGVATVILLSLSTANYRVEQYCISVWPLVWASYAITIGLKIQHSGLLTDVPMLVCLHPAPVRVA